MKPRHVFENAFRYEARIRVELGEAALRNIARVRGSGTSHRFIAPNIAEEALATPAR